jgi:hypothetical protein
MLETTKKHLQDNKKFYIGLGIGICIAGITYAIMRDRSLLSIRGATIAPAKGATIVLGKNNTLNSVSYISSHRQGPPSWVVRCLETRETFPSQKDAAMAMGISPSVLSSHLNGFRDHVDGLHFERICMAA